MHIFLLKILLYDEYAGVIDYLDYENGNIKNILTLEPMIGIPGGGTAFHKFGDELFFTQDGNDIIYKMNEENFEPYLVLDYQNKENSKKLFKSKQVPDITIEEITNNPYPVVHTIFKDKSGKICLSYTYKFIVKLNIYDKLESARVNYISTIGLAKVVSNKSIIIWDYPFNYKTDENSQISTEKIEDITTITNAENPILIEYELI